MRVIKFRQWSCGFMKHISNTDDLLWNAYDPTSGPLRELTELNWMQFTGLKDKNGVEVYESDVIEFDSVNRVVKFIHGCWMLEREKGYYINAHHYIDVCEVIGNIYENKELLEKQNES